MKTYTFINLLTKQEIEIESTSESMARIILGNRVINDGHWVLK
jgi:hypothetical protein